MQIVTNPTYTESGPGLFRRIVCGLLIALNVCNGSLGAHAGKMLQILAQAGSAGHTADVHKTRVEGQHVCATLQAKVARARLPAGLVFVPEVVEACAVKSYYASITLLAGMINTVAADKCAKRAAAA